MNVRKVIFLFAGLSALVLGGYAASALMATEVTETHTVPFHVVVGDKTVSDEYVLTDTDTIPDPVTVTETVTQTVTVPPPTTPPDVCPNLPGDQETVPPGYHFDSNGNCVEDTPPSGNDLILPENTTWRCTSAVNYDRVVVNITQQTQRQDAVFLSSGCTGHIGSLEVDTWASDGMHIGPFAHDLVVDGGHIIVHDRCGTACDPLHADVIQVLGGSNITFNNLNVELQYAEGTNSALYINCGNQCQQRPTDIVFNNSTFRRSPTRNRTVRIGNSIRSGLRNSTVYYCGTGPTCDAPSAAGIVIMDDATDPVNENNTLVTVG